MMRIASFELFLAACFFTALLPAQTQFWDKSSGPFGGSILTFYVHSDGRIFTGVNSVGAFVSSDNGVTWSPFNTNLLTYFPSSFVADASGYIYTTGDIGVSKSPISSPSWTVVYGNNGSTLPVNVLAIGAGGILYAGTAINGLAKSTNGGATWVTLGGGAPQTNYQCLLVTSFGHIFAGTVGNGPSDGIFRSTDSGISWKMVSKPSQFRAVFSIVQKGADLFAATTSGIFRSSDIGNTWTSVPGPFGQRFVLSLVAGSDGALLAGTEGGGFLYLD